MLIKYTTIKGTTEAVLLDHIHAPSGMVACVNSVSLAYTGLRPHAA